MNFLNEVCKELLARRIARTVAPLSSGEKTAIQVAKSWTGVILSPAFQPPEESAYIPFRVDASSFDILRVRFPTRYGEVLIAQTFCVFSVVMEGGPRDVNALAKGIFNQKDRIRLKVTGTEGGVSYGQQPAPPEERHRDWMDHLRWWTDGDTLGFLTLKQAETLGKAMMGWGVELNRDWFR